MGLFGSFLAIKRGEQELRELQVKAEETYYHMAVGENELLKHEKPEVRKWLKQEFDFQYAMNRIADSYADRGIHMPYHPPKTEDTIKFARAMAKLDRHTKVSTAVNSKAQKPSKTTKGML